MDGGEVETIYPVNTVTAKTAHLITICFKHYCRAGLAGSVTGRDGGQNRCRGLVL